MVQPAKPADRQVFPREHAVLATYARETTDGDRETRRSCRPRKRSSPAPRQTQFDKTDSCLPPSPTSFQPAQLIRFAKYFVKARPDKLARVRKCFLDSVPQTL